MRRLQIAMSLMGVVVSASALAYSAPVESRNIDGAIEFSRPFVQQEALGVDESPAIQEPLAPSQQSVRREEGIQAQYFERIEQLIQEVSQLRGVLEVQEHRIGQLEQQLKQQYSDLDQRLGNGAPQTPVQSATISQPVAPVAVSHKVTGEQLVDQHRLYSTAYSLLKEKKFSEAKPLLAEYVRRYPDGQYAVNAHYWLGELLLVSGETQQAKIEFNTVISDYADSSKRADAMLKLGFIYADEGEIQIAKKQLMTLKKLYPDSPTAKLAERRLSRLEERS